MKKFEDSKKENNKSIVLSKEHIKQVQHTLNQQMFKEGHISEGMYLWVRKKIDES